MPHTDGNAGEDARCTFQKRHGVKWLRCTNPKGHVGQHYVPLDGKFIVAGNGTIGHDVAQVHEPFVWREHDIATVMMAQTLCGRSLQGLPFDSLPSGVRWCSNCTRSMRRGGQSGRQSDG